MITCNNCNFADADLLLNTIIFKCAQCNSIQCTLCKESHNSSNCPVSSTMIEPAQPQPAVKMEPAQPQPAVKSEPSLHVFSNAVDFAAHLLKNSLNKRRHTTVAGGSKKKKQANEMIQCEFCDNFLTSKYFNAHKKTKKHKKNVEAAKENFMRQNN